MASRPGLGDPMENLSYTDLSDHELLYTSTGTEASSKQQPASTDTEYRCRGGVYHLTGFCGKYVSFQIYWQSRVSFVVRRLKRMSSHWLFKLYCRHTKTIPNCS